PAPRSQPGRRTSPETTRGWTVGLRSSARLLGDSGTWGGGASGRDDMGPEGLAQVRERGDPGEVDAEVDDRLGDQRADARDHALCAEQLDRADDADEVVGRPGVDGLDPGDVEDRKLRPLADDRLEQLLHHL